MALFHNPEPTPVQWFYSLAYTLGKLTDAAGDVYKTVAELVIRAKKPETSQAFTDKDI